MAKIITSQEYEIRLNKVQDLLKSTDIEALLVTLGTNFRYLLGSNAHPSERLTVGILSKNSDAQIVCPAFETLNFKKTTPVPSDRIHPWQEAENPNVVVQKVLNELSIEGKLALSPETPFTQYKKLESIIPNEIVDGYEILRQSRMSKTENEIKCLQKANEATSAGIESAISQVKLGMTEKELAKIVSQELSSRSGEPVQFAAVQFGENSADPHAQPSQRKLKENEVILIDAGTTFEGYHGDITNTTFFGKPTKEFLNIYEIVEEAQQLAIESAKSGALPENVDKTARDFIKEKGYGFYFTHRTGHGIGLDVHEDPYIVSGNKEPLEVHSAHSVEPGIYLEGKFGVRIEDCVHVQNNKQATRFANVNRRLWES